MKTDEDIEARKDRQNLLMEEMARHFDTQIRRVLELEAIPATLVLGEHDWLAEAFEFATEDEQSRALALFLPIEQHATAELASYLREEMEMEIDETLFYMQAGEKKDLLELFSRHRKLSSLKRLLSSDAKQEPDLEPLYLSTETIGYATGCLALFVQDPQEFRHKVTRGVIGVLVTSGKDAAQFLGMDYDDQVELMQRWREHFVAVFQALDSEFPRERSLARQAGEKAEQ